MTLLMLLITLQSFAVAGDVHPQHYSELPQLEQPLAADSLSANPSQGETHHDSGHCGEVCKHQCCHHGSLHALMPNYYADVFLVPAHKRFSYQASSNSPPSSLLFRPPKA